MQTEAIQHVLKCTRCLRRKTPSHVAPLHPIHVTQPLELVHMDYLSLEPSKGNIENVLVITDHFTSARSFCSQFGGVGSCSFIGISSVCI